MTTANAKKREPQEHDAMSIHMTSMTAAQLNERARKLAAESADLAKLAAQMTRFEAAYGCTLFLSEAQPGTEYVGQVREPDERPVEIAFGKRKPDLELTDSLTEMLRRKIRERDVEEQPCDPEPQPAEAAPSQSDQGLTAERAQVAPQAAEKAAPATRAAEKPTAQPEATSGARSRVRKTDGAAPVPLEPATAATEARDPIKNEQPAKAAPVVAKPAPDQEPVKKPTPAQTAAPKPEAVKDTLRPQEGRPWGALNLAERRLVQHLERLPDSFTPNEDLQIVEMLTSGLKLPFISATLEIAADAVLVRWK